FSAQRVKRPLHLSCQVVLVGDMRSDTSAVIVFRCSLYFELYVQLLHPFYLRSEVTVGSHGRVELESVAEVSERRMLKKLLDNTSHPPRETRVLK
ncbi:uncharacterized, partial [Tachysurus ichikawai]